MSRRAAVVLCLCLSAAMGSLAAESVTPGEYLTEGAWGSMRVAPASPGRGQHFGITSVGGNGHTCELEGDILNGAAKLDDQCTLEFAVHPDRISVRSSRTSGDACRAYCGMRAGFEGDYYPVVPFCRTESAVRAQFLRQYKAAQYRQARDTLQRLLTRCERFMDWHAQAEVRNDLALTELRLRNKPACLKALEPLKRDLIDDPARTGRVFAPVDAEWGEAMVKTTRFNWKKCGGVLPPLSRSNTGQDGAAD